jgi:hypothetical protein
MHVLLAVTAGMFIGALLGGVAAVAHGAPAPKAALHSHVVVPGDTLIGLLRPGADWRPVQRANAVADPRRLRLGSTLKIPFELLRVRPATATLLHARGNTQVIRTGSSTPAALPAGATVSSGDVLITGAQSSLTLQMADGSRLLLRPDSRLRLEALGTLGSSGLGSTGVQLDYGSTDTLVTPAPAPVLRRYQLRTPVANLGVRGTEFRTRTDAHETHVEVLTGSVESRAGSSVQRIDGGFGAVIGPPAATLTPPRAQPQAQPQAQPLLAAPELSKVPMRIEKLPLTLAWTASPAATGYRAQVFASAGGSPAGLALDGRFDAAQARWPDDLPDGPYELRVRAVAPDGLEGQDASKPFMLKARPEPPFISRPRNGERVIDAAPAFAWSRSSVAASYRLQVASGADFQNLLADLRTETTEQRIELPRGSHHWRVASVRADGDQGPYGDPQLVVCIPPPAAPQQQPPEVRADGLLLRWRGADEAGARYRLQVAIDPGFERIESDQVIEQAEWLLRHGVPAPRSTSTASA